MQSSTRFDYDGRMSMKNRTPLPITGVLSVKGSFSQEKGEHAAAAGGAFSRGCAG
jgi:hypothetical protein